jgi:hypothetical protein
MHRSPGGYAIRDSSNLEHRSEIRAVQNDWAIFSSDTWPTLLDPKAQIVIDSYLIANRYAKAVTGTPTQNAIAWAEGEIKRVYEKS